MATAMGPWGCVALRLRVLLWRRAFSPGAWPAAVAGLRLRLLSVGRLPVGPTLGKVCPAPDRARGLHGGPGLEERAEGTAGEGRPESGTGGTGEEEGAGSQLKRLNSSFCISHGVTKLLQSRTGRDCKGCWHQLCISQ